MIVGIVLAAGLGSRYRALTGRNKLTDLIPAGWPNQGQPVLLSTIQSLTPSVDHVVCVIPPDNTELTALLSQTQCKIVPLQTEGLGRSLSAAVQHSATASCWLVALGDMPFIRPDTIAAIASAIAPGTIVAPFCQGRRGHPVGFGRHFKDDLIALSGDMGARTLLDATPPTLIPTDDTGTITDMDQLNIKKQDTRK